MISLEHAIRSASGLPADILKLPERGYLKSGLLRRRRGVRPRDIPRSGDLRETAPVLDRRACFLFVNGKEVIGDGKVKDVLAGRVLRHKSPADR